MEEQAAGDVGGLLAQLRALEDSARALEKRIQTEAKKAKGASSVAEADSKIAEAERTRERQRLSLADEKALLKRVEKLRADRRVLQQVEAIKAERQALLAQREEIARALPAAKAVRKHAEMLAREARLVARISKAKGGVVVTADMLVTRAAAVPKERIGRFVGRAGANLAKLEEAHAVALDVGADGAVTVLGVAEDVEAAVRAIEQFSAEAAAELPVSEAQLRVLRNNKGTYIKNIESVLGVTISTGAPTKGKGGVLHIRGMPAAIEQAKAAVLELSSSAEPLKVAPNGGLVRRLFDDGAAEMRALEKEFGVSLDVDRDKGFVRAAGPAKSVQDAMERLQGMALESEEEEAELILENPDLTAVVIGKKGATVRQLELETGANISVDKPGASGNNSECARVLIRAPQAKLGAAKDAVQAVLDTYAKENATLHASEEHHAALFGPGGAVIKRLQEETGATITMPRRDARNSATDKQMAVRVRGPEQAVAKAMAALRAIIAAQTSAEVDIPEAARPAVIGPKGAVISKIQVDTLASITLQGGKALVRGSEQEVQAAVAQIEALLDRFRKENLVLHLLPNAAGTLIGKGGATLNKVRESSGATIEVSMPDGKRKKSSASRPSSSGSAKDGSAKGGNTDRFGTVLRTTQVQIRGSEEAIAAATEAITALVGDSIVPVDELESFRELSVPIPSAEATGKLVGKSGETIRSIEARYNVRIAVERGASLVHVCGKAGEPLLEATREVEEALAEGVVVKERYPVEDKRLAGFAKDPRALRRLRDEAGVLVLRQVLASEPTDEPTDEPAAIVIEGSAGAVERAKTMLAAVAEGAERSVLQLPAAHAAKLAAHARDDLDRLEQELKLRISVDPSRAVVRLWGMPAALRKGSREVIHLVSTFFPDQVASLQLESAAHIPLVIGKKGATIRKVRDDHKVFIEVHRDTASLDILGTSSEATRAAVEDIKAVIHTWATRNGTMEVPLPAVATVIGKKGATIDQVRDESGVAAIDVDGDTGIIKVRGEAEAVEKALTLLRGIVAKYESEHDSVEIEPHEIPGLIGQKGVTIRAIEDASEAKLRVDKASNRVFIRGSAAAIATAKSEIGRVLDELRAEHEDRLRQHQQHQEPDYGNSPTDHLVPPMSPPPLPPPPPGYSVNGLIGGHGAAESSSTGTAVELGINKIRLDMFSISQQQQQQQQQQPRQTMHHMPAVPSPSHTQGGFPAAFSTPPRLVTPPPLPQGLPTAAPPGMDVVTLLLGSEPPSYPTAPVPRPSASRTPPGFHSTSTPPPGFHGSTPLSTSPGLSDPIAALSLPPPPQQQQPQQQQQQQQQQPQQQPQQQQQQPGYYSGEGYTIRL